MTSLHGQPDRLDLDAYLDDVVTGPERARMAREISASRELQAEVALQERIDASLQRSLSPGAIPQDLLAKLRENAPTARTVPLLRRRRVTWIAATAAALAWGALAWQYLYLSDNSKTSRYDATIPLATIYHKQVAAGFQPKWVCDDDREFASTFLARQGQGLLLAAMPPGSKMVGLTYCGGLSRYTTTMLARVGDAPIMVFVDRMGAGPPPQPPASQSGLHLFQKELGSLVLYELTPLGEPRVMDYLYLADVPASK
jgi:hypothetical protein